MEIQTLPSLFQIENYLWVKARQRPAARGYLTRGNTRSIKYRLNDTLSPRCPKNLVIM